MSRYLLDLYWSTSFLKKIIRSFHRIKYYEALRIVCYCKNECCYILYYFKYKYWNLKNFNFLKNCFAGPNRTWYPLPDVVFVLASSFWQIAFVKWKLLPFVQIVSRIIIVLCDNSWGPFEFITSTIAWKRMHFKIFM